MNKITPKSLPKNYINSQHKKNNGSINTTVNLSQKVILDWPQL